MSGKVTPIKVGERIGQMRANHARPGTICRILDLDVAVCTQAEAEHREARWAVSGVAGERPTSWIIARARAARWSVTESRWIAGNVRGECVFLVVWVPGTEPATAAA